MSPDHDDTHQTIVPAELGTHWDIARTRQRPLGAEVQAQHARVPDRPQVLQGQLLWSESEALTRLAPLPEVLQGDPIVRPARPEIWGDEAAGALLVGQHTPRGSLGAVLRPGGRWVMEFESDFPYEGTVRVRLLHVSFGDVGRLRAYPPMPVCHPSKPAERPDPDGVERLPLECPSPSSDGSAVRSAGFLAGPAEEGDG